MRKITIWQRLNTPTVFLIVLLLTGAVLAFWVERSRNKATVRNDVLDTKAAKVLWKLSDLSYTQMRLLVNPQSEPDQKLNDAAAKELNMAIKDIETNYNQYDNLMDSLKKVREFAVQMVPSFQQTNLDLQEAEGLRRDPVLKDFSKQVEQTKTADSESSRTLSKWGFAGMIVILGLSMLVIIHQARVVSEPLGQLVGALERMRQGDFTHRIKIERNDDFGVVGDGLNRLADDLSVLVGQVQRSGIQVNSTAAEIAETAKQQQGTASEIAATTAGIGVTSKQISATSRELVKTMNEVSDVAQEAARVAGSGQTAITSMEATMRQIIEASGSITGKLAVLNEKTSNINSVVTTITKVADQTNLLSLNAAIEAEKAGEYGLGFGVVAMEIRRLADQTAVATYDIEKMVKEMQSAVAAGVRGMDKFSDEVRQGVEEIRQVSVQLARIIHSVQALTPRFQIVNEGMQSQAAGAQHISETLTQLSEAVHQTAESLRQSTQAIEQLNGAARSLQSSVTRFKLEGS